MKPVDQPNRFAKMQYCMHILGVFWCGEDRVVRPPRPPRPSGWWGGRGGRIFSPAKGPPLAFSRGCANASTEVPVEVESCI